MDYIEVRLEICNACPYNANGTCILCGCVIEDKVKRPDEICPHMPKKWDTSDKHVTPKQGEIAAGGTGGPSQAPHIPGCIPCNQAR